MKKRIASLKNHYIVCGAGNVEIHVINEMISAKQDFVVIEISEERIKRLTEEHPNILYIQADATNENILKTAGIEHAKGLSSIGNRQSKYATYCHREVSQPKSKNCRQVYRAFFRPKI